MDQGKPREALDQMVADLKKDPTRSQEQMQAIGMMWIALRDDPELNESKVREFIEGFSEISGQPKKDAYPINKPSEIEIPKYKALEFGKKLSPEEEQQNAEDFITNFVLNNDKLTPAAKKQIINAARTTRGPWIVKDNVKDVTQKGEKITIDTLSGQLFLYLKK